MTVALVFLALIMALVIGYLLSQTLNRQPWLTNDPLENRPATGPQTYNPRKLGLGVFMAVVTSLFGLFFSAYAQRMELDDWARLQEPGILWLNTALLVVASLAMNQATRAARAGHKQAAQRGLLAGGVLAMAFIVGQLLAWKQLTSAGLFVGSEPALAFFYLLTAIHGLHMLGGLWVWGRTSSRLREAENMADIRVSIELCTIYWHFMLLVWIFLFALLLNT